MLSSLSNIQIPVHDNSGTTLIVFSGGEELDGAAGALCAAALSRGPIILGYAMKA